DRRRLTRGDPHERRVRDRLDEAEAEQSRRLALGGAVLPTQEGSARRIADRQGAGEGGPRRLLGLAFRQAGLGRGDLAAGRCRVHAAREDRLVALLLRTEAQDVVAGEDVHRSARLVVADTDLVDEGARAAERGLEVAAPAGAAVEDRADLRNRLDVD